MRIQSCSHVLCLRASLLVVKRKGNMDPACYGTVSELLQLGDTAQESFPPNYSNPALTRLATQGLPKGYPRSQHRSNTVPTRQQHACNTGASRGVQAGRLGRVFPQRLVPAFLTRDHAGT